MATDLSPPPDAEDFLLETPLYAEIAATRETLDAVLAIRRPSKTLDCHCGGCRRESVFELAGSTGARRNEGRPKVVWVLENELFEIDYDCTRCEFRLHFSIFISANRILKFGQFPSLADLQLADVRKYRQVLAGKYPELTRAIGLSAHGVGVGSFVYLRRVFEWLVEKAHETAKSSPAWNEQDYQDGRMAERILQLVDQLPEFLVENRGIYSILSKGLHELTENECLEHFVPIRMGIELILEEEIERQEKEEKRKTAVDAIRKIQGG